MAILRSVLAVFLAALALPAAALALPGDEPFAPLEPADGATLTVDAAGIAASYSCPVYRVSSAGDTFNIYGGPKDYAILVATSAALDPDGRLAAANRVSTNGGTDIGWTASGNVCSGRVAASGGPAQRFQEIPGTYYWQVSRICTGCDGSSYEVGPVRRLELRSAAAPELGSMPLPYAGFPALVPLELPGLTAGTPVSLDLLRAGVWKELATATTSGASSSSTGKPGVGTAVATFPKSGTAQLRIRVTIGNQEILVPTTLKVLKGSSRRKTSARDDGKYVDTGKGIESLALSASVKRGGRELSGLKAKVPATCPGITPGTFTTQILTATFGTIRIAPDGRFVGTRTTEGGTFLVSGRITKRKLQEGRISASLGACIGDRGFNGKST